MFDFLQGGIGGTAEGPMQSGQAGIPVGPTWDSLLRAVLQYSSSGKSATPMVGGMMPQGVPTYNLQGLPQQQQQKQGTSAAQIASIIKLIGAFA